MKNLSCHVLVISVLLFACGSESDGSDNGTGGGTSDNGAGGDATPAGTGGASPAAGTGGTGGTAGSPGSAAGGTSTPADAVGESGLPAATLVSDLGVDDLDTLCSWMESVLELERGATKDDLYAAGTYSIQICPDTRQTVNLWASPALCIRGLAGGQGEGIEVGCSTLDVAQFESCMNDIAAAGLPESLCQIDDLEECRDFDQCYRDVIN